MTESPWVRRVMRRVDNLVDARANRVRLFWVRAAHDRLDAVIARERLARRKLRALLREQEASDAR